MFGMPDQMLIQIVKIFDRGIEPPCAIEEVVSGFMHQFRDIHTAFEEGDLFGGGNYSRVLKRSKEPALFQLVRGTEVRSRDQLNSRSSESLSDQARAKLLTRSEEHTSELQSLMRISYAVFCLKKKKNIMNVTSGVKD